MNHHKHINLENEEEVLLIVREHIFSLGGKILIWLTVTLIPFGLQILIKPYIESYAASNGIYMWNLIKDVYLLLAVLALFVILTIYYLNVYIVTNKRVIDMDQIGITHHRTSETHMNRIQDVSASLKGVWGSLFNFGDVDVQSAGDIAKITFEKVPKPKKVKRVILDTMYSHPGHRPFNHSE